MGRFLDQSPRGAMTAAKCVGALERARDCLDELYRACDQAYAGKFNDLGCEAGKRLNQMIWVVTEIGRYLEIERRAQKPIQQLGARAQSGQISPDEWRAEMQSTVMTETMRTMPRIGEPLEILTEAFYWIAFRARRVIRLLPEMGSFEAEGVRNTRNKLIEHSDAKDSGVVISSFAWGAPQGPVLKAIRYSDQFDVWPDQGLFRNALEFAAALKTSAEKATKRLPSRT